MHEFEELLKITDRLLGPDGCPWDQVQTLQSLRSSVLEETCELIEAIDLDDNAHIREELGDFFFNAVFFCKIAEKEKRFKIEEVLKEVVEKLIRRHPHVFGSSKINDLDAAKKQWEMIKAEEKGKTHRKSILDGISKDTPSLARAQKIFKKLHKKHYDNELYIEAEETLSFDDEETLGKYLLNLVKKAEEKGLDAEHALRKTLTHFEKDIRSFEKS